MKVRVIGDASYLVSYTDDVSPAELQQPSSERTAQLASMPYPKYLRSPEWRERRRIEIQAAERKCSRCRRRGQPLEVHHLTYERRGRENPDDLRVLCEDCHRLEHGR